MRSKTIISSAKCSPLTYAMLSLLWVPRRPWNWLHSRLSLPERESEFPLLEKSKGQHMLVIICSCLFSIFASTRPALSSAGEGSASSFTSLGENIYHLPGRIIFQVTIKLSCSQQILSRHWSYAKPCARLLDTRGMTLNKMQPLSFWDFVCM